MSIRVFLADDHAVVRDGLEFLLQAQPGITVIGAAANGRDAVQQIRSLAPDVVVMDIAMPQLNGIEATRQICELDPAPHVVILSMHASTEYIFGAFQAGAQGYLLKESAGIEVVDAVRTVSAGNRYLSKQIAETVLDDYVYQRQKSLAADPLESLSSREREVLQLVAEGHSSADIGKTLSLSPKTVETYRSRLMAKLNLADLPSLIKFAIQRGLIHIDS